MSLASRSIARKSVERTLQFEDDNRPFAKSITSPNQSVNYPSSVQQRQTQGNSLSSALNLTRNHQSPAKEYQIREQRQLQELMQSKHGLLSKLHFICREIDTIAEDLTNKDEIIISNLQQEKNKWIDLFEKKEQDLQSVIGKAVEEEKIFQSQKIHLIQQIELLAQENKKLQANSERMVQDIRTLGEKKDNLEREKTARENQLIQELQQIEAEHKKKTEDFRLEYERQLQNLIAQYNQTAEAYRNLQIKSDQLVNDNKFLHDEDKKNKNLINNLKAELEQQRQETAEKDVQLKNLSAANAELEKRSEFLRRNLQQLESENQDFISRLSNSQRTNQELELEIQTWVKKFGHLEQGHQQHLAELKRQIDLEKKNLLENEVQRQTQKLRIELSQNENRMRTESQKVEDMEKLYAQLLIERENLQHQNRELEQIVYELKQDMAHFSELELDNRKMLAHIQYIEKKADQSLSENSRLKLALEDSKARNQNREKGQQDLINRLESERDQLEKILSEHIAEIERQRNLAAQQENFIEKAKETEVQLQDLKMQNEDLNTKIKLMTEDLKNLAQFRAKYHELANQYDKLRIQSDRKQFDKSIERVLPESQIQTNSQFVEESIARKLVSSQSRTQGQHTRQY